MSAEKNVKEAGVEVRDQAPPLNDHHEHHARRESALADEPSFVRPSDLLRPRQAPKTERKIDQDEREALVCYTPSHSSPCRPSHLPVRSKYRGHAHNMATLTIDQTESYSRLSATAQLLRSPPSQLPPYRT